MCKICEKSESPNWTVKQGDQQFMAQVIPNNDFVEHTEKNCICVPKYDFQLGGHGGMLGTVVHQALDGRP